MLLGLALSLGAVGCGESESAPSSSAAHGAPEPNAVTAWSDTAELFLEYPDLVAGSSAELVIHWTWLADFSPATEARLSLVFSPDGGGAPVRVTEALPSRAGIFTPSVSLPTPGAWNLRATLEGSQHGDEILVPGLVVHERGPEGERESPGDAIRFLKEHQWRTAGFRVVQADVGRVALSFPASGEIQAAAGRYAEVAAPLAGLVDVSAAQDAPLPGERVERGEVLMQLTPTLGESGSAYANARRELREAEQELDRAKRLLALEAVPERRLSEARIRYDAAHEALAGLTGGAQLASDGKLAIRAPISGVVAARELAAGARVAAGDLLFTLIDPEVVWLRVHVPASKAAQIGAESEVSFRIEGGPRVYQARGALSVGSIVDARSRTVPILYEVENADGSIKIGAHIRARISGGEAESGVVIPDSAIVDEDGRPIAYVQIGGERFERRELTLGARDGRSAVVRSGIARGERVVSQGASRVRLQSRSGAAPPHDHGH